MKAYCDSCNRYSQVKQVDEGMELVINDTKIYFLGKSVVCQECGEEIYTPELIEENLQKAHDIYKNMEKS